MLHAYPANAARVSLSFAHSDRLSRAPQGPEADCVMLPGNVYCTFGNFTGAADVFTQCWAVVLELAQAIGDSPYVTEAGCCCVAVVDFLPAVKIAVFFTESIGPEDAKVCLAEFYEKTLVLKPALMAVLLTLPDGSGSEW
jgi:hypothetical protein